MQAKCIYNLAVVLDLFLLFLLFLSFFFLHSFIPHFLLSSGEREGGGARGGQTRLYLSHHFSFFFFRSKIGRPRCMNKIVIIIFVKNQISFPSTTCSSVCYGKLRSLQ